VVDLDPGFSRRALALLIVVVMVSFGVFVAFTVFDAGAAGSAGPDADSVSALGHRPFVDLLQRLGIPVSVGRWYPARRAGEDALLVVAEPRLSAHPTDGADGLVAPRERRATTLLVLPKRTPHVAQDGDAWVDAAGLVPLPDVERVLARAGVGGKVVRVAVAPAFDVGPVGIAPTIVGPVQLLAPAGDLEPLVTSAAGVLLGWFDAGDGPPVAVLSDPDVLAAHGLRLGRNPEFVVGWVEHLRPEDGVVVFDAASQGRARAPSLARELLGWPLVLATLSGLVAALAAVATGVRRFGAPRAPTSPFAGRTKPVVDHAADLALDGGHTAHALERYLAVSVAAAARDVHAPPGLASRELHAWLDRAAAARGHPERVAALHDAVGGAARGGALTVATRIHAWRSTFSHGPHLDP